MSSPQSDMATTHPPQSLPSFAQTFGSPESLSRMPDMNNALPPIQHRDSPFDRSRSGRASPNTDPKYNKKRLHSETGGTEHEENTGSDGRRSPRTVRVKQETESDSLPPPRLAPPTSQKPRESTFSPPSTSNSPNPSKKRRTLPIDTDVRRPSVDNGISPVVMGFTIPEDDPKAMEQVRSMINLKQQQQALIEQRRGSTVGVLPPTAPPDVNVVNAAASSEGASPKNVAPIRGGRRSPAPPAGPVNPRRSIVATSSSATMPSSSARPASPPSAPAHSQGPAPPARNPSDSPPTQTHLHPSGSSVANTSTHALPPPPISFARRRASRQLGQKGKPADIVISPRSSSESHLQPYIQSAPPIPRGSQSQTSISGRPTMALPSLLPPPPPGQTIKRFSTVQVPPTPTRLALSRHSVAAPTAGVSGRSPPAASIPIASTLVPPTPASLHHPGYSGEKSAFLAPFEMFYDALSDSKQLKTWLGEQLQKSNALLATLQRQQDQVEDTVNAIVDKKVSVMREEIYGLRIRVDELETALRATRVQGYSPNMSSSKGKTKANGYQVASPIVPDAYTFPPLDSGARRPEPIRRVSSPTSEGQSFPPSQNGSPVPFDIGRRLSVSAMRLDPPRPPPQAELVRAPPSHLPPRELPPHNFPPPPPPSSGSKSSWSPLGSKMSLPSVRSSLSHSTLSERPSLVRRSSGGGGQSRMNPPEKRRASRSPEVDEEGRRDRGPAPVTSEEARAESGRSPQQARARSPVGEQ